MTFRGRMKNGVVILEDKPTLSDGTIVQIQPVKKSTARKRSTLGQRLTKFAGTAKGLPRDMARNHDHYIHGTPKK